MPHPLGEVALLVPRRRRDAARPDLLAEFERHLSARGVDHRRVPLGDDPAGPVRREVAAGVRLLVVCGGQDSLAGVVPEVAGTELVLGAFPGGAPNDFARTFGLDTNPEAAALLLSSDRVMRVDVGLATFRAGGEERRRHVVNEAVVGLDAAALGARRPRTGAGRLWGWWRAVATYRARPTDVDMVFAEWHAPATAVRLANGQYAHDGLVVAPLALPDDGAWDVQVWDGARHLPFTLQPAMLRGEHLPHDHVRQWRQKHVAVDARPPAPVAVDGRRVGTTPATFDLLPGALRLKI